ncbi:glycosyltransferase family 32 protein [Marinoscillum luteum]|uniref:Glycosyltransferase family 32 protein n=1 Tax=Marinoscillum luteum TaxID=861051 RepID=A0ABW7N7E5_9BACT
MKLNIEEIKKRDPLTKNERLRSNFVQRLVQNSKEVNQLSASDLAPPPKQIVQFWDDLEHLPKDVEECMESWRKLEQSGFDLQVFNEESAKEFIKTHLGSRFEKAFVKCYHPSMKSDYFRYSYIFVKGGFYIDADDVYHGNEIDHLFKDGRLKLQPFCYDIETSKMVPASVFTNLGANKWSWIFYFNTTPLIAAKNHPIVERTLLNATLAIEAKDELPEVQATTGPGILTTSIFEMLANESYPEKLFLSLNDWEEISTSKWQLSYRNDSRNWRLSNQQTYQATQHNES